MRVFHEETKDITQPPLSLSLSFSLYFWESLQAGGVSVPVICLMKCQSAVGHASSQRRYTVTHGICLGSSQEGLECVRATVGITTRFPAKIFTTRLRWVSQKSVIIHIDDGLAARCIIPRWQRGLCNIRGEKENIQMYICLLFWQGNVDGHARRLHYTGQLMKVCPCCWFDFFFCFRNWCSFMTPILCDKSQHQSGDSFMASFTLHFQPWASFWLGL